MFEENKNLRFLLIGILFIMVLWDFTATVSPILADNARIFSGIANLKGMQKLFLQSGYMFRAAFLFVLFVVAYNELFSMKRKESKMDRTTEILLYGGLFLLFGLLFVFVREVGIFEGRRIMIYAYIFFFVFSFIACIAFAKALANLVKRPIQETDLSPDTERIVNENTFWFKVDDGYINIRNAFQGVFVNGGAGAGKSASIAHPVIFQMAENGWTGIVYDFKFFDLTNVVYSAYKAFPEAGQRIPLKVVNFTDMSRTHRINPLNPAYLTDSAFIEEFVSTILKNLNKEWIKKTDFFATSAILTMKAIVMFFAKNHPDICDIPHIFVFINNATTEKIVQVLKNDRQALAVASSLAEAVEKEAMEQVAGVIATLKSQTQKLENENFYWVLSPEKGEDINLALNDPNDPRLLCLINDQQKTDTITPIISLIITVARKLMNVKGKEKSIFLLDEAPTLYLPRFEELPNTGRSNRICSFYMGQDLSQMDTMYGKDVRRNITGSLGNTFFGNATEGETLKYVAEFFGKEDKIVENTSVGHNKNSGSNGMSENISFNIQEKYIIRPQEVASLEIGRFCGKIVARNPNSFFMAQFKQLKDYPKPYNGNPESDKVPSFATGVDVKRNYERIYRNVDALLEFYCGPSKN